MDKMVLSSTAFGHHVKQNTIGPLPCSRRGKIMLMKNFENTVLRDRLARKTTIEDIKVASLIITCQCPFIAAYYIQCTGTGPQIVHDRVGSPHSLEITFAWDTGR